MWRLPGSVLPLPRSASAETAASTPERTSLDGHGIFTIIVFALVSLVVLFPLKIPIPHRVAALIWRADATKERAKKRAAETGTTPPPDPANATPGSELAATPSTHSQANLLSQQASTTVAPPERRYIVLNHVNAPMIGVIVLLATRSIGGKQVKDGIVGAAGVEPYDVLLFFISLAYIAISLDATGLLRFIAFTVCIKAGSQGRLLFLLLYLFFWTAGVLVGNDPVILSGTAFLVYLTRVAGIVPPSAWIWAQFVAANVSSAVLVSSNPTNLVIASAFGISFPTYTAYMVLPSFGSAVAALIALVVFFRDRTVVKKEDANAQPNGAIAKIASAIPSRVRPAFLEKRAHAKSERPEPSTSERPDDVDFTPQIQKISYIPATIVRPEVDARAALVDKTGAIFVSFIMAATLGILIATSVTGHVKVYQVALPGAAVCIIRDATVDYLAWRKARLAESKSAGNTATATAQPAAPTRPESEPAAVVAAGLENGDIELASIKRTGSDQGVPPEAAQPNHSTSAGSVTPPAPKPSLFARIQTIPAKLEEIFPTVSVVMSRLPFPLLPFAFGMFILVQGLAHVGFIWILADGVGKVCAHGPAATAFFISTLGIILCNVAGTNIGATIILTEAIRSPSFTRHLPPASAALITKTALYSVALGSNIGALGGTFAASLAGLLWREGLRQGGIKVTTGQFALWCAVVIAPATAAGVGILLAEVIYFKVGE
ncbi:hypothetical protein OC844_005766 [Tilletia horrida]|nr:hypothetical protein OC844_005766 [Tilletia horrida]